MHFSYPFENNSPPPTKCKLQIYTSWVEWKNGKFKIIYQIERVIQKVAKKTSPPK